MIGFDLLLFRLNKLPYIVEQSRSLRLRFLMLALEATAVRVLSGWTSALVAAPVAVPRPSGKLSPSASASRSVVPRRVLAPFLLAPAHGLSLSSFVFVYASVPPAAAP